MGRTSVFTTHENRIWRDFARVHIPRGGPYEIGAEDVDLESRLEQYASTLHVLDRVILRIILHLFDWTPLFFFKGVRFTWMSDEKKLNFLRHCSESRFSFKRMLVFLPKFMVNNFFYADPRVEKAVGYFRYCDGAAEPEPRKEA